MSTRPIAVLLAGTIVGAFFVAARADDGPNFPSPATFTTRAITPFAIEGLTGDAAGYLYTTGRQPNTALKCPVWRIAPNGTRVIVAFIQNSPACNPSGITFDRVGNIYIADSAGPGTIWAVAPHDAGCAPVDDASNDPACASVVQATAYATGVPGTNGLAFDRDGNLWTGDGTTGQGRVWRIKPHEGNCMVGPQNDNCKEMFRVQPMSNEVNLDPAGLGGVGRDVRSLPPGTITVTATSRNAANTLGSQALVANGVAFNRDGDLYVADTARGAIWKVEFDRSGVIKNRMGCDQTFAANTLCLDSVFVAHPYLEGTDGIALDRAGNIWNAANERNAIVVVSKHGLVVEVFRTAVNPATGLRNDADTTETDATRLAEARRHILEFPTSPFFLGNTLCVAQSDGDRRDNSPRAAGEINGGAGTKRGKISCMDQALETPGLPLPVR